MEYFQEALKQGEVSLVQLDTALAEQAAACACPEEHQHSLQLDSLELWKQFHQHTNEMIITKAGRRMFPLIQLSLGDLDPLATYHLLLALRVKDSSRWRFLNGEWTGSEPVIRGVTCEAGPTDGCVYTLPPASGEGWMKQSPVGFSKLKLSNKDNGGGKVKLSSLHRYQPVAYLVKVCPQQQHTQQAEASCTTTTSLLEIYEHELPETQFIAVTAYQNDLITQMKIKHNPFAKAFLPNPDKASSCAGPPAPAHQESSPVKAPGAPLPVEAEAVSPPPPPWPPGYIHQQAPHFPPYYYSDGHYPPLYQDYYDTFSPVPAPPYQQS